jgi:hypothetical protein
MSRRARDRLGWRRPTNPIIRFVIIARYPLACLSLSSTLLLRSDCQSRAYAFILSDPARPPVGQDHTITMETKLRCDLHHAFIRVPWGAS